MSKALPAPKEEKTGKVKTVGCFSKEHPLTTTNNLIKVLSFFLLFVKSLKFLSSFYYRDKVMILFLGFTLHHKTAY